MLFFFPPFCFKAFVECSTEFRFAAFLSLFQMSSLKTDLSTQKEKRAYLWGPVRLSTMNKHSLTPPLLTPATLWEGNNLAPAAALVQLAGTQEHRAVMCHQYHLKLGRRKKPECLGEKAKKNYLFPCCSSAVSQLVRTSKENDHDFYRYQWENADVPFHITANQWENYPAEILKQVLKNSGWERTQVRHWNAQVLLTKAVSLYFSKNAQDSLKPKGMHKWRLHVKIKAAL